MCHQLMRLIALNDKENGDRIIEDTHISQVKEVGSHDPSYRQLIRVIGDGFPQARKDLDEDLRP